MPKKKIRILFLIQGVSYGGGTRSFLLLLRSLDDDLFEKYVLSISSGAAEIQQEIIDSCDYFEIIKLGSIAYNQSYQTADKKFRKYSKGNYSEFVGKLTKLDIDILHINSTIFPQILRWVKENSRVNVVTHLREHIFFDGNHSAIQKYIFDQTMAYSDALIAISKNEAEAFKNHKKLAVLSNPFDFSNLDDISSNFKSDYGIDPNTIIVAMLSQFIPNKGHPDFLRSLTLLKKNKEITNKFLFTMIGVKSKRPVWKRIVKRIMGMDDYRAMIDKFIAQNQLDNDVLLVPFSNNIFSIIVGCDIIVRPSLAGDPWGRDIIEAMALKKPVIATGESEYYIENGKTGYLVPPNNPTQLAERIAILIDDPYRRKVFGEEGHNKVRVMCDVNSYGEKVTSIYDSLLK